MLSIFHGNPPRPKRDLTPLPVFPLRVNLKDFTVRPLPPEMSDLCADRALNSRRELSPSTRYHRGLEALASFIASAFSPHRTTLFPWRATPVSSPRLTLLDEICELFELTLLFPKCTLAIHQRYRGSLSTDSCEVARFSTIGANQPSSLSSAPFGTGVKIFRS